MKEKNVYETPTVDLLDLRVETEILTLSGATGTESGDYVDSLIWE